MTSTIETTKRALFDCLDRIKRAAKHRVLTAEFEERLEEHLEELRKDRGVVQAHLNDKCDQLARMTEERDQLQDRLHAVDRAYVVLDQANKVAGEEFNKSQTNVRHWREECGKLQARIKTFESGELYQKLQRELRDTRQDVKNAETFSEGLYNELVDAKELIVRQREKIGELFMEREGKQAISPGNRNLARHMSHVLSRFNAQT